MKITPTRLAGGQVRISRCCLFSGNFSQSLSKTFFLLFLLVASGAFSQTLDRAGIPDDQKNQKLPSTTLWADKNPARQTMAFSAGQQILSLQNLVVGQDYHLFLSAKNGAESAGTTLSIANSLEVKKAPTASVSERFKAVSTVQDFVLDVSTTAPRSEFWVTLSKIADPNVSAILPQASGTETVNITATGGISATALVNALVGGTCVTVSNVTSSGAALSRGTFNNGAGSIGLTSGINSGIVLSTGDVAEVSGPNDEPGATTNFSIQVNDPDLATVASGQQRDLSRIEFDFTTSATNIQFQYVFGSEEYCEYVGSNFNDAFGFFISGPGITGVKNLALLPNSTTPVSINNVNHLDNTDYFVSNSTDCDLPPVATNYNQLDGWTTTLTAATPVVPGATYHIKLAIADLGDGVLNSAVFLKGASFSGSDTCNGLDDDCDGSTDEDCEIPTDFCEAVDYLITVINALPEPPADAAAKFWLTTSLEYAKMFYQMGFEDWAAAMLGPALEYESFRYWVFYFNSTNPKKLTDAQKNFFNDAALTLLASLENGTATCYGARAANKGLTDAVKFGASVASAKMLVSPNPTPGPLAVQFLASEETAGDLQIFDASGRLAYRQTVEPGTSRVEIDLAEKGFANGFYTLRVCLGEQVLTRKVSVVR